MKLHIDNEKIRSLLFKGQFGLEKESLRVDQNHGYCAQSPHPFDHPHIVQDFAENQTEINTPVCNSWKEARAYAENLTKAMLVKLDTLDETLWPFSNPCPIVDEGQIPMWKTGSDQARDYRRYLSRRYGRYKMVYSGIHYNFSFDEEMLQEEYRLNQFEGSYRDFKDRFYLDLTQKVVWYGWIIDVLCNASPIYDGSLLCEEDLGKTGFAGMSSMRNSALGYWNFFSPRLDYSSMKAYTASIERYVDEGLLKAPRELYYPVRLKPKGSYSMQALNEEGANHIELRMIDLNPYEFSGMSEDDAWFCHLLLVFLSCMEDVHLSWKDQIYAAQNFKNASKYALDQNEILFDCDYSQSVQEAALSLLEDMQAFFESFDPQASAMIGRQMKKITDPKHDRLANRIRQDFPYFASDGLIQALDLQKVACEMDRAAKKSVKINGSIPL